MSAVVQRNPDGTEEVVSTSVDEVLEVSGVTACESTPTLRILNFAVDTGIEFKQMKITGFSDTVTPSWNEEIVYGRMDPIATYQGTTRTIELSFELGPFSESDDRKRLALTKISRLMQMQYPTYASVGSATSISQPPLLEISFENYIRDQMCYLTQVSYKPVDGMSATTVPKFDGREILPQRLSVSLSLKVLHTVPPGWDADDVFSNAPVGPMEIDTEVDEPTIGPNTEDSLPIAEYNLDGSTSNDGWEAQVINTSLNESGFVTTPATNAQVKGAQRANQGY